jgi:acyl carrier protein
MDQVERQIFEIIRQSVGKMELRLEPAMTPADVPGWDSITHVRIVVALEKRFNFQFETAEVVRLQSELRRIGDLTKIIHERMK